MSTLLCDTNVRVSSATASRCLNQVVRSLYSKAREIIRMPSSEREIEETRTDFFNIAGAYSLKLTYTSICIFCMHHLKPMFLFFFLNSGIPWCVGAIDCCQFRIQRPSTGDYDAHEFINRKGWYGMNVQVNI